MSDSPAPRARLRLANVRRAISDTPWAILPVKLEEILAVVEAHAEGVQIPAAIENPFAARRAGLGSAPAGAVALVPIYGTLTQRAGMMTEYSGGTAAEAVGAQIDAAVNDPNVGTIVLDVDSPGGSTAGITELAAKIFASREKKRVIAVANTLCASAAYWLASQAHEVVATPSAIVGSIGVYTVHSEFSEADKKAGITNTIIRAGKHKAEDTPYTPLSPDAEAAIQALVDENYAAFTADVARGRGVTPAAVRSGYGEGSALPAKLALEEKLVDRIATLEDVLGSLGASLPRSVTNLRVAALDAPTELVAVLTPNALLSADTRAGVLGTTTTAHTSPAPEARSHPVSEITPAAPGAAPNVPDAQAILAAERTRASTIRQLGVTHQIEATQTEAWINAGATVETVNAAILATLQQRAAAGPQITVGADRAAEKPFETLAAQLKATINSAKTGEADKRLLHINAVATGSGSTSSADGGFLIQSDFQAPIQSRMWQTGEILKRVAQTPVAGNSLRENVLKENSRANGSRNGGMLGYWGAEADTITATKPALRTVETALNKVFAAWYATDELLEDAPALESEVMRLVPDELTFQLEDKIVNGTGAGVPLGVLNSGALVSVAIEGSQTLANEAQYFPINFAKMFARLTPGSAQRAAWFVNQEVMGKVMTMTLGAGSAAIPVWLPPGQLADAPNGTILGRPVVPVEYCAADGTPGDILLSDFSDYRTINKGGVQQAGSIHVQFLTDQQVFRWTYRVGGQPRTNSPITPYKGSATLSPYIVLAVRT